MGFFVLRAGRGKRGQPYQEFKDRDFHNPATNAKRGKRGQPYRQFNDLNFHNFANESVAKNKQDSNK